jgi:hypothetical protein
MTTKYAQNTILRRIGCCDCGMIANRDIAGREAKKE